MEPHGVIEAGHLHGVVGPAGAMGQQRGVEQRHVGRIRDDAGVEHGVGGQLAVGAHPHPLVRAPVLLALDGHAVDVAHVDGAGLVVPLAQQVLVGRHALLEPGQAVGLGQPGGHGQLVVEAGLVAVEAGLEVEDDLAVLDGHDASGGEALAVADAVDLVQDRHGRVARPQEVGVQGVHRPGGHRARRGHEGLAGDLAAEDPLAVLVGGDTAEDVHLDGLEVEDGDQLVERSAHRESLAGAAPDAPGGMHATARRGRRPRAVRRDQVGRPC